MSIDWSTVQLSLRPKDEKELRIAREFALLWGQTCRVGEELGWQSNRGAIVQLYFEHNDASAASTIFVSPSKRDRFLFRVTPKPGRLEPILDALHARAKALAQPPSVVPTATERAGGVSVDVVEVTSSWEAVIGEDHPDGPTVEKRLQAFVGPLLRAVPCLEHVHREPGAFGTGPAMPLPPALTTLLEKAATDNGFDVPRPPDAGWLSFASTHAPLRIWLGADAEHQPLIALSREDVARALAEHGSATAVAVPPGGAAVRALPDVAALHRLLRRAYQLARTLPNELLHEFEQQTATLPRTTEAERLVVQRVGQDLFRAGLMDYWEGRCAITGLAVPELLRASHIKPWADCPTDAQRLDVFNGLLLAPHLDAAFDGGFMTVADGGEVIVSESLSQEARRVLGFASELRVDRLTDAHREYLSWHRERVFTSSERLKREDPL